jgi:hypothetical protein
LMFMVSFSPGFVGRPGDTRWDEHDDQPPPGDE